MENSIYIGIARQQALQEQMNIASQNIANVNTTGYRAGRVLFETELNHPNGMKPDMAFPATQKTYRSTDEGVYRQTGNDTDMAIQGDGFFSVTGADGKTYYTRAGNFKLNSQNQLVTQQGFPVQAQGGGAITIPEGTRQLTVSDTGSIAGDGGVIAQLDLVKFDTPRDMKPVGNTLYEGVGAPKAATDAKVMQGNLEGSNVQGVLEMTEIISITRDYQSVQKMIQQEDQRLRQMIQTITRIQA